MSRYYFYWILNTFFFIIATSNAANVPVLRTIQANRRWDNSSLAPNNGLPQNSTMASTSSSFSTSMSSLSHTISSSKAALSTKTKSSIISTKSLSTSILSSSTLSTSTLLTSSPHGSSSAPSQPTPSSTRPPNSSATSSSLPISPTSQPSQTSIALAAVTEANEAISIYQKSPTSNNAKDAQSKVNHALDLSGAVGRGVAGFGGLIDALKSTSKAAADAVHTPGAATASALGAAADKVKQEAQNVQKGGGTKGGGSNEGGNSGGGENGGGDNGEGDSGGDDDGDDGNQSTTETDPSTSAKDSSTSTKASSTISKKLSSTLSTTSSPITSSSLLSSTSSILSSTISSTTSSSISTNSSTSSSISSTSSGRTVTATEADDIIRMVSPTSARASGPVTLDNAVMSILEENCDFGQTCSTSSNNGTSVSPSSRSSGPSSTSTSIITSRSDSSRSSTKSSSAASRTTSSVVSRPSGSTSSSTSSSAPSSTPSSASSSTSTSTSSSSTSTTSTSTKPTSSSTPLPPPKPTPTPAAPKLTCNGLDKSIYANRDTLMTLVDQFCADATKQGGLDKNSASIFRHYLDGTMDMTDISIDYPPGHAYPGSDKCTANLHTVIDGCDTNNNRFKAGGNLADGDYTYRVSPRTLRQPASKGVNAHCSSYYKAVRQETQVWGQGWETDDWGHGLLDGVMSNCAGWDNTWQFSYGLGSDGREWTASFMGGIWQRKCIGNVVKTVSGISDFGGCEGSG